MYKHKFIYLKNIHFRLDCEKEGGEGMHIGMQSGTQLFIPIHSYIPIPLKANSSSTKTFFSISSDSFYFCPLF